MPENNENLENETIENEVVETPEISVKVSEGPAHNENSWFQEEVKAEEEVEEIVEEKKPETVEEKIIPEVVEGTTTTTTKEEEKPNVPTNIDETAVSNFIKEKYGIDAKLEELVKPKEVKALTPEVEKFLEFKDKTGNSNFSDFLATQKDWSQEPKEVVLMENLKAENPTLNEKQLNRLYEREYGFDPEVDDDDEIMDKEINIERDFQKGLKVLEERKQEFMVPRGSDESIPEDFRNAKSLVDTLAKQQQEDDKLFEENRSDYLAKTENIFTDNFEGFKVKIGNDQVAIKPENIQDAKKEQSDLSNFNNKYFDPKTGKVTDAEGLHKALYFGMNADKVAEHFYNLGKSSLAEEEDKLSKNIVNTNSRQLPENGASKITVRVVE